MSRPVQIVCDGCGKVKQDSNHWWMAAQQSREASAGKFKLALYDHDAKESDIFGQLTGWTFYDFCGQDCALKFISEQMSKGGC
jgi:hypothetical protein